MTGFVDQSIATQTAFTQIYQTAILALGQKTIASVKGVFSSRMIKGHRYWYYQFNDSLSDKFQQIYLGPDSPEIRALADKKQAELPSAKTMQAAMAQQVRIGVSAGANITPLHHFRVIKQLADYGFFHAGGVLVGTHAFMAYANMLGIHWSDHNTMAMTLDVDFAHAGNNLSLALPCNMDMNISDALERLNEGFLPVASGHGLSATWVHPRDPDYQIDFLTSMGASAEPVLCPRLGIALKPLKFMEFSLEDIEQTVLFNRSQAVLLNVPNPARYTVHKLIVYSMRTSQQGLKNQKDLMQVAALSKILARDREDDLSNAWHDAWSRGPSWRKRLRKGLEALHAKYPDNGFLSVGINDPDEAVTVPVSERSRWKG